MNSTFSLMLFTFGIAFLFVGIVEYFFPRRSRNQKGYRTKNSLKSQEHWVFAQKYSAKLTTKFALILIGVSIFGMFFTFSFSDKIGFIASVLVLILTGIIIWIKTEKAIKKKFE